jgi:hypothetical protein
MKLYPPQDFIRVSSTEGHVDSFGELFKSLRSRWVKVERLQEYDESDFEGYRAFKRGKIAKGRRLVQKFVKSQDVYEIAQEHNVSMVRIRIYERPLSRYLANYEIAAYLADIECGEDIRVIDAADIKELLTETGISDYLLFDDRRVLALVYDVESLSLSEARLVKNPTIVSEYIRITEDLIARSRPMLEDPEFRSLARRVRRPSRTVRKIAV